MLPVPVPTCPMTSGLSHTLQQVHAGGAAVPSPPVPVSHHQGWNDLETMARAAGTSPRQGVSSLVAPRERCFTSPCQG